MRLLTLRNKAVSVVVIGVGLLGVSAFSAMDRSATQPGVAMFTLPGSGETVDLEAYRQSFNRWPRTGGHTRTRRAGSTTTDVTIEAYPWAHAAGPNHVPPAGRALLVGHLVNEGSATTTMYSLQPGSTAEYFLFITNVDGQAGWEMREVANAASGPMPVRASGLVAGCNHAPAKSSEADFKSCAAAAASASAASELKLASTSGFIGMVQDWIAARSRKATLLDDPAWISCDAGCCTLNAS